jgi:hypothetical protein
MQRAVAVQPEPVADWRLWQFGRERTSLDTHNVRFMPMRKLCHYHIAHFWKDRDAQQSTVRFRATSCKRVRVVAGSRRSRSALDLRQPNCGGSGSVLHGLLFAWARDVRIHADLSAKLPDFQKPTVRGVGHAL